MTASAPFAGLQSLTIFDVAQMEGIFEQALQENNALTLDASEIAEIDAAGLQWLLASAQRLQARGGSFTITSPSAEITEALTLSGLLSLTGVSND